MKILIFSQYFWPENFRINDIAKFLSKNHEVNVLTSIPSYPNKKYFKNKNYKNKIKNLKIIRVPVLKRSYSKISIFFNYISFTFMSFFYLLFFFIFKKIDKIFIFGTSPPSTLVSAVFFNIFKRTKIIYWVLDLWPDTLRDLGYIKSKRLFSFTNNFLIYLYNNCELILCQSQTITKILKKRTTTKTKYFPSWCEEEYFRKKKIKVATEIYLKFISQAILVKLKIYFLLLRQLIFSKKKKYYGILLELEVNYIT